MNTEVLCALIAGAAAVFSALAERRARISTKRTEARAQRREKESRLAMELMYATCSLSLTTAKKLAGLHTNGDVEEAMTASDWTCSSPMSGPARPWRSMCPVWTGLRCRSAGTA